MTIQELAFSYLTKVLGKTEDEIKALIFDAEENVQDSAFDSLLAIDTARIKRFKDDATVKFNNGYNKAKEEILTDAEKQLKETFGITDELTYPELLLKAKEVTAQKSKLTSDDVKKHPDYLKLEQSTIAKSEYEKLQDDFEGFKKNIDKKVKFDKVKDLARTEILALNPNFPDDEKIKSNLINVILKNFEDFEDAQFVDNDIVLVKEGKRLEDAHGNPIKFKDLTKTIASEYVTFKVQDGKGGAGNGVGNNGKPQPQSKYNTKEEKVEAYNKLTSDADRKAFLEANPI